MTNTFCDISGKIDNTVADIISHIDKATETLNISYFIVGAVARDIINSLYGIKSFRATNDIDFAVNVANWEMYNDLIGLLVSQYGYRPDPKLEHRYYNSNGIMVDIIPYGEIENPNHVIKWLKTNNEMSTIGFEDAYNTCITIEIRKNPELTIKIPTPASIVLLKFISWNEKYPERAKDAQDIIKIIEEYSELGNSDKLSSDHYDILAEDTDDFDHTLGFARILGRDIALIAKPDTMETLIKILERETNDSSEIRLIRDMLTEYDIDGYNTNRVLQTLKVLKLGLTENHQVRPNVLRL